MKRPVDKAKKSVGEVIKSLRKRVGITRHALAKAAQIDPAVLARLENDPRPGVQFATICRLAEALDVSVDDLAIDAGLKRTIKRSAKGGPPSILVVTRARSARGLLQRALRELDDAVGPD